MKHIIEKIALCYNNIFKESHFDQTFYRITFHIAITSFIKTKNLEKKYFTIPLRPIIKQILEKIAFSLYNGNFFSKT